VATNAVLMLSDLDVVCSFLFMAELVKYGGINLYFFFVIIVGLLTYLLGAMYYGPKQRFKTMKVVLDLMQTHSSQFVYEPSMLALTADDLVNPAHTHACSFKDCPQLRMG